MKALDLCVGDFFAAESEKDFPKVSGGTKEMQLGFPHSKPGKQPIFPKIFKIQGTQSSPAFPSDAHDLGET